MTEIIMELSEEELPDYVNALLDQNRELREENAALWTEVRAFRSIVSESAGVAGYHLSGNIASWDELNIPYAAHLPPPEEQK